MKYFRLLLLIFILSPLLSHSQKSKVKAAYNYYKEPYQEYDKAKASIDEAVSNPETKSSDMAWYYRGLIYSALNKNEKYGNLCNKCLETAYESFSKSLELNPKSEWAEEIKLVRIPFLMNQVFGEGVDRFKAKNYSEALSSFETVLKMSPGDTSVILNAAYSAELAGNSEKAKIYYNQLTSMHYPDDKVFLALSNLYKQGHDTSQALSVLKDGRTMFPDSLGLMLAEINIYLARGNHQEAIDMLNLAIAKDQKNQSLYLALGSTYDNLANPKDSHGNDLPKPGKYTEYMTKSEQVYKQGLQVDPNNFEINFNLGALYFNQAAEMANAANDIKNNDEFEKAKTKYNQKFKESEPYLEKALELNPGDMSTMNSLKQLYVRTGETEKYNRMKEAIDKAK
jgi:tetratricopeptide (TPR) repeat protein